MDMALVATLGVLVGLVIGIAPAIGATTGLIILYPFIDAFAGQPHLGVIFITAAVAASTSGDTVTSILFGIPGSDSSAASVVDGYPLAKRGLAAYALSSAFVSSTINGAGWGLVVFLSLPLSQSLVLTLNTVDILVVSLLSLSVVMLLANRYWVRGGIAVALGLGLGLVGYDSHAAPRLTLGWDYLNDGIQLLPVASGLFALTELLPALFTRMNVGPASSPMTGAEQRWRGLVDTAKNGWLALRGGAIGALVGILPGISGAVADWLAYAHTIASNPADRFGNGNIKGVIGCEGANNAQKASSLVPTILFGIPGAPFAAVMMVLFLKLDIELGAYQVMRDGSVVFDIGFGYVVGTIVGGIICWWASPLMARIRSFPIRITAAVVTLLICWACYQYSQSWEDLALLAVFTGVGFLCKRFKVSRPALLLAFVLAGRIDKLQLQAFSLYSIEQILLRPSLFVVFSAIIVVAIIGFRSVNKIEFY